LTEVRLRLGGARSSQSDPNSELAQLRQAVEKHKPPQGVGKGASPHHLETAEK